MIKFTVLKKPLDDMDPPRTVEVQLCVSEFVATDEGLPEVTHWCVTEREVEAQVGRVIAALEKKKSEALAILRKTTDTRAKA